AIIFTCVARLDTSTRPCDRSGHVQSINARQPFSALVADFFKERAGLSVTVASGPDVEGGQTARQVRKMRKRAKRHHRPQRAARGKKGDDEKTGGELLSFRGGHQRSQQPWHINSRVVARGTQRDPLGLLSRSQA